jgi:phosphonopyruvate decarboxylase
MVEPKAFFEALDEQGFRFYAGVPDSLLKDFCAYVTDHTTPANHVITANEGGAVALAAGYHMGTGQFGVVYMQNSGQGNAVNPLMSLTDPDVCGIPLLLLIGWRGEPGTEDEPQHVKQGKITLGLLDTLGIRYSVLPTDTSAAAASVREAADILRTTGAPYALVARADTFAAYKLKADVKTSYPLNREGALTLAVAAIGPDPITVGTTGKTSRELFELRQANAQPHDHDFRTVGCMGHASQIALGLALSRPDREVYCLDGDGAVIMHMGALAIIGAQAVPNFKHVVFNNGAHDSVGGQPTVGFHIDIASIARACGYRAAWSAATEAEITAAFAQLKQTAGPALLEIKVNKGARANLGRPTISPSSNKQELMSTLHADATARAGK